MMARTIVSTFFIAAASMIAGAAQKPNIVFILSDDHASEAISAYGSWLKDYAKTPNIDRIANEGMLFTNVCCNNSICSPSRASIMTGQYSHKNGVIGLGGKINETSPWLSEELKKSGYQTWLVGKWHLGSTPKGFDDYRVVKGQGTYYNPKFLGPNGLKEDKEGDSSDVYTDTALNWLRKRDKTKPFCMMLQFKAPHHPYDPAERHMKLLADVKVPEPPTLYEDIKASNSPLKTAWMARTKFHMVLTPTSKGGTREEGTVGGYYSRHVKDLEKHNPNDMKDCWRVAYQHMVKTYIRCVTGVDENVGRVLAFLDKEGLVNNTIVVYTADQGYWLGQHGFYDKRLILEGSIKMPLIIRYPKMIKARSRCDKICVNVDFAPTLLDLCGIQAPDTMQGRSMVPLLKGESPADWRTSSFYAYWAAPAHCGLRNERYTMAIIGDEVELYDRQTDPNQTRNIAGSPESKPIIDAMQKDLAKQMADIEISKEKLPPKSAKKKRNKGSKKKRKKKTEH